MAANLDDNWLTTAFRAIVDYLKSNLDQNIYDVIGSFPPDSLFNKLMPFDKTVVHIEIDDISHPILGFGDNVTQLLYNDVDGTVIPVEAKRHVLNFDLGVWASELSGGESSRLVTYQLLERLFNGVEAYRNFFNAVGMEIQSFRGGNFIPQTINDMEVWNIAGIALVVQCFSSHEQLVQNYIQTITDTSAISS